MWNIFKVGHSFFKSSAWESRLSQFYSCYKCCCRIYLKTFYYLLDNLMGSSRETSRTIWQSETLLPYFYANNMIPQTFCWKSTPLYQNMQCFRRRDTLQYLSFVPYFAIDFKLFLRKFHSMNPLVHILYDEMRDCYRIFCRSLSNQSI